MVLQFVNFTVNHNLPVMYLPYWAVHTCKWVITIPLKILIVNRIDKIESVCRTHTNALFISHLDPLVVDQRNLHFCEWYHNIRSCFLLWYGYCKLPVRHWGTSNLYFSFHLYFPTTLLVYLWLLFILIIELFILWSEIFVITMFSSWSVEMKVSRTNSLSPPSSPWRDKSFFLFTFPVG